MKNLPFSWRKKGADLYEVGEKKVMTLLKATHRGIDGCCQDSAGKHAASGKSRYLDDRTIVMSYGSFEAFKVCSQYESMA